MNQFVLTGRLVFATESKILQGLETLVECLNDPSKELRLLAAETVSNICKIKKARRAMRNSDGISRLVMYTVMRFV